MGGVESRVCETPIGLWGKPPISLGFRAEHTAELIFPTKLAAPLQEGYTTTSPCFYSPPIRTISNKSLLPNPARLDRIA
jgi:hypothetical protein